MLPVSLRIWKTLDSAKQNTARLFRDDKGAGEFVAVIILIVIIIAIGMLLGPFKTAVVAAFDNIGNSIKGSTSTPGSFTP